MVTVAAVLAKASKEMRVRLLRLLEELQLELLRAQGVKGLDGPEKDLKPEDRVLDDTGRVRTLTRTIEIKMAGRVFALTKSNGKYLVTTVKRIISLENGQRMLVWDFGAGRILTGKDWEALQFLAHGSWTAVFARMISSAETVGKSWVDGLMEKMKNSGNTNVRYDMDDGFSIVAISLFNSIEWMRPNPGDTFRAGKAESAAAFAPKKKVAERLIHLWAAFGYAVLTVAEVAPIPGAGAADEGAEGLRKLADKWRTKAANHTKAGNEARAKAAKNYADKLDEQAEAAAAAQKAREGKKLSPKESAAIGHRGLDPGCFTGETAVRTDRGYLPIRDIQRGMQVLSTTASDPIPVFRHVTEKIRSSTAEILLLQLGGKHPTTLSVTPNHPMAVSENRFLPARSLRVG
ncbi:MAG: hypothetical protein AAF570_26030, partial [Bacteroidota bacterium]